MICYHCDLLEKNGFSCQIETSGTHEVRCTPNAGYRIAKEAEHARRL